MTYSIAIRTLGTAGDKFKRELESIKRLSLQPDKVIVYIAEGFPRPEYQIGKEQYVWVKKGMMAQRLLDYNEIDSDIIYFLDDDIELTSDSAEKMIRVLEVNNLDALGADVFKNHKMSLFLKFCSAIVNFVTPHFNHQWAIKIKKNGAFSYIHNPNKACYLSQSCAGPAWMIRKSVYERLRFQDELWLDNIGYAYGDDQLESYKIYKNGYKLGLLFTSGIIHLDAKSESEKYHKNKKKIYLKTKVSFAIWWRTIFSSSDSKSKKFLAVMSFATKTIWTLILLTVFSLISFSFSPIIQFFKGNVDGWRLVHSQEFISLPSYVLSKT